MQDSESIQEMLEAVCKGLARGRLKFSDDADEVVLKPRGLLDFQVVASSDDTEDESVSRSAGGATARGRSRRHSRSPASKGRSCAVTFL